MYVAVNPNNIPRKKYDHCTAENQLSAENKLKPKDKFFEKFLVWLASDETDAVSKPFIHTGTINSEIYLNECLKKRLIPFISGKNVVFWSDMAIACYSRILPTFSKPITLFLLRNKVMPIVPQVHERFWALLKRKYVSRVQPTKNLTSLKRIIGNMLKRTLLPRAVQLWRETWERKSDYSIDRECMHRSIVNAYLYMYTLFANTCVNML